MVGHSLCFLLVCISCVAGDDTWKVTSTTPFPKNFFQTVIMEGLCTDGRHFIIGTKDQIFLVNESFAVILSLNDAIPHDLRNKYGYNHLGDCQYDEGLIYFPVEEPSYTKPAIFVYSLSNNSIDFVSYKSQDAQQHAPWIAMDPVTKHLFSSNYDEVSVLQMYDQNLSFVGERTLSAEINQVQGGAFCDGILYVGVNSGDTVYAIDVLTGQVDVAVQQTVSGSDQEYEFEGITFLDLRDRGMGLMHNTGNHRHPTEMIHAEPVSGLN